MSNIYLGIDYGTRKSGLAYAHSGFVFGIKTVPTGTLDGEMDKLIRKYQITHIILGLPLTPSGKRIPHTTRVEQYRQKLIAHTNLPVILVDESESSIEAKVGYDMDGISEGDLDVGAARIILERYLDQTGE